MNIKNEKLEPRTILSTVLASAGSSNVPLLGGQPPSEPPDDEGKDRLILRTQAAKIVGCSVATLRRLERTVLPPILVDEKGVHWHSLRRVREYASSLTEPVASADDVDGAVAAAAFELLDNGADAVDVVKALKIEPGRARRLQNEWANMRGVMLISGMTLSKIRSYRTTDDNPILTGEELLLFLEQVDSPECAVCRRPPTFCLRCYHRRPGRAEEMVALAIRQVEEREAELVRQQGEKATYDQARERAAYDPRAAAAARAAEEARIAERREQRERRRAARQATDGGATTPPGAPGAQPRAGRLDAEGGTTSSTVSASHGDAGATSAAAQPTEAAKARRDVVDSPARPGSASVADGTRPTSATPAGDPPPPPAPTELKTPLREARPASGRS